MSVIRMCGRSTACICSLMGLSWLLFASWPKQVPTFKATSALVEVYVTVTDQTGRYVTGLSQDQFEIRENGVLQEISKFEATSSELSCAILLDATGSMSNSLPIVKNATVRLIDNLRPNDSIAVYSFSTSLRLDQDFTQDKVAAKKAVLAIRPGGQTAWFDAVAQIATDLSKYNGKKTVVAFTDGGENASFLNANVSITRARIAGIPIYTIAQGEALRSSSLMAQIRQISMGTGGWPYTIRNSREIDECFMKIAQDLQNTYMLAYQAPPGEDNKWRTIQVIIKGVKNPRIRAKQGYFPK